MINTGVRITVVRPCVVVPEHGQGRESKFVDDFAIAA